MDKAIKKENYQECEHCGGTGLAEMIEEHFEHELDGKKMSLVDKIRAAKKHESEESEEEEELEHYAHGGYVGEDSDEEGPGTNIKPNILAKKYTAGDKSQISKQPRDSNLKGQKLPKMHERIEMIRKRLRKG